MCENEKIYQEELRKKYDQTIYLKTKTIQQNKNTTSFASGILHFYVYKNKKIK